MIKAIIFDFGGPIVEWKEGASAVLRKYDNLHNLREDSLWELYGQYLNSNSVGDSRSGADFYRKTKPPIDIVAEELDKIFGEADETLRLRPEMVAYIEELKKKYQIALLSNFTIGLEEVLEKRFHIRHLFDLVVSSYDLKIKKPDARIYQYTLEKLGILPEESVFIDDAEKNVLAAKALGIHGIVFENVSQCKSDLEKLLS